MKKIVSAVVVLVALVAGLWLLWEWGFCRFYVGPDEMAVITAKTGENLPPGQILAKPGQRGILEDVLGEGRHFRNPWLFDHEIRPVTFIPPARKLRYGRKETDMLDLWQRPRRSPNERHHPAIE